MDFPPSVSDARLAEPRPLMGREEVLRLLKANGEELKATVTVSRLPGEPEPILCDSPKKPAEGKKKKRKKRADKITESPAAAGKLKQTDRAVVAAEGDKEARTEKHGVAAKVDASRKAHIDAVGDEAHGGRAFVSKESGHADSAHRDAMSEEKPESLRINEISNEHLDRPKQVEEAPEPEKGAESVAKAQREAQEAKKTTKPEEAESKELKASINNNDNNNAPDGQVCSICGVSKYLSSYSKAQNKKPLADRKCKACVEHPDSLGGAPKSIDVKERGKSERDEREAREKEVDAQSAKKSEEERAREEDEQRARAAKQAAETKMKQEAEAAAAEQERQRVAEERERARLESERAEQEALAERERVEQEKRRQEEAEAEKERQRHAEEEQARLEAERAEREALAERERLEKETKQREEEALAAFKPGDIVQVNAGGDRWERGILRYLGPIEGTSGGNFAGVELPFAGGRNDGSAMGKVYFRCPEKHGIFVPLSKIRKPVVAPMVQSPESTNHVERQRLARERRAAKK